MQKHYFSPEEASHYYPPLKERWETETAYLSNLSIAMQHSAFLQIIELGPPVIIDILRDLQDEASWIVLALPLLTTERPDRAPEPGVLTDIVNTWLEWGISKGYLK